MENQKPHIKIKLSEFKKEEMEVRNWSMEDLAGALELDLKTVNVILNNKAKVSNGLAKKLSNVFKQSPEYWLGLGK